MLRQTMWHGILLALAGLALPTVVWGGCPSGNPLVENGTVGGSFATIQAAINAASPGDTLLVSPGTYNEQLTVNKAGIILRSLKGSSVTCVRRPADGAVILVSAANVTIGGHDAGFTLGDTPNALHGGGSGIKFDNASPNGSALDNVIQNMSTTNGYILIGINSLGSNTLIADNLIQNLQSSDGSVSGVELSGDGARITHNVIRLLKPPLNYGYDLTGIYVGTPGLVLPIKVEIVENVISDLHGYDYGRGIFARVSDMLVRGNRITRMDTVCCGGGGIAVELKSGFVRFLENDISLVDFAFQADRIDDGSHINYNNFNGTSVYTSGVEDYSNNSWGCPGGPGASGCGNAENTTKFKPFAASAFHLSVPPLNP